MRNPLQIVRVDKGAVRKDLRQFGVLVVAAGVIGYFIEPIAHGAQYAILLGLIVWCGAIVYTE